MGTSAASRLKTDHSYSFWRSISPYDRPGHAAAADEESEAEEPEALFPPPSLPGEYRISVKWLTPCSAVTILSSP